MQIFSLNIQKRKTINIFNINLTSIILNYLELIYNIDVG